MTHLINRLQFEMNCPDEELAFHFRYDFGENFQDQIIEVVDKVCSKYIGEDEWIQLDKLEIDIGRFSPHSFSEHFAGVFFQKFEKELVEKLAAIGPAQKQASKEVSLSASFRYFLLHGTLPWWANAMNIDLNVAAAQLFHSQPELLRDFFYKNRFHPDMWTRMVFQLNNENKFFIISFFEMLGRAVSLFDNWTKRLYHSLSAEQDHESEKQRSILQNIVLQNASFIFEATGNDENIFRLFSAHAEEILSVEKIFVIDDIDKALIEIASDIKNSADENVITEKKISDMDITNEDNIETTREKYTVKEAGIVLLAPFLQPFFNNLGLLDGRGWKNKQASYKAVHLLKFLSTGKENLPEYSLVLEKLICGLTLEEPVPLESSFTEPELNEADSLLSSVLEHWKVLKNTSVSGLRENFLKRDGLIKQKEDNWILQVERKTLDVLLDNIPWGYSTIRLPWNHYFISVEW